MSNKDAIPPELETSNRIRVVLLGAIVLVATVVGLITLFQEDKGISPEILADIEQHISSQRLDLLREGIAMNTVQPYTQGEAQLRRSFNWTADIPFFADTKGVKLAYDQEKELVKVEIAKIQLLENIQIQEQTATTQEQSLWEDESSMDEQFWAEIMPTTAILIDAKLTNDEALKDSFYRIAKEEVKKLVKRQFVQRGFHFVEVQVNILAFELISGQLIN